MKVMPQFLDVYCVTELMYDEEIIQVKRRWTNVEAQKLSRSSEILQREGKSKPRIQISASQDSRVAVTWRRNFDRPSDF